MPRHQSPSGKINPKSLLAAPLLALAAAALLWASAPATAQSKGAAVITVMGKAEIKGAAAARAAEPGSELAPGETLETAKGAQAELLAPGGKAKITVTGGSRLAADGDKDFAGNPWGTGEPEGRPRRGEKGLELTLTEGGAEVEAESGAPLRVVTPLLVASVRGTRFSITAAADGSSAVTCSEGRVLAERRDGVGAIAHAGSSASLSAADYAKHLEAGGVTVPDGDWRKIDPAAQREADLRALSSLRAAEPAKGRQAHPAPPAAAPPLTVSPR